MDTELLDTATSESTQMAIRILIADDHTLVRQSLAMFLRDQSDMEVVGEARDGFTVVGMIRTLRPDVVIMDISMPILNGIDATRWVYRQWPDVRIIALSMHSQPHYVKEMLNAGARGYLLKDCDYEELLAAIRVVAGGGIYLCPGLDYDAPQDQRQGE